MKKSEFKLLGGRIKSFESIEYSGKNLEKSKRRFFPILSIITMLTISIVSAVLLFQLLFRLKEIFFLASKTAAQIEIESYELRGITLSLKARVVVRSELPNKIDLIQVKLFNASGEYLDSWGGQPIDDDGNVKIVFSNKVLFNILSKNSKTSKTVDDSPDSSNFFNISNNISNDKSKNKMIIDGFVRVNLLISESGIKINLPVKTEVLFFEEFEEKE